MRTTGDAGAPFADIIESGIRRNWSGTYDLTDALRQSLRSFCPPRAPGSDEKLTVTVTTARDQGGRLPPSLRVLTRLLTGRRRPARIYVRRSIILPAHAASFFLRRFWGFFRTGQIESIGLNWSPRFPGYITIPGNTKISRLPQVAAHEAGHLFGLGDAYDAWYRFFHAAPGTDRFMMRHNACVQPLEIAMLLRAHTSGKMSYFPRAWIWKDIGRGILSAARAPLKRLFDRWKKKEKI